MKGVQDSAKIEPTAYVFTSGRATVRVMPKTVGSATDAALKGREVNVTGCIWRCGDEKRAVWAEVK